MLLVMYFFTCMNMGLGMLCWTCDVVRWLMPLPPHQRMWTAGERCVCLALDQT